MKDFILKYKLIIIFTATGFAGGFLYWKFVGCLSGTCPIKSVWYWSTLYGGLLGYLVGSLIQDAILKYRNKKSVTKDSTSD
jgi:hypothetical protein